MTDVQHLPGFDAVIEEQRLAALDRYDILDTPSEEAFDRITRLTRKLFRVPIAVVSVIDAHRQWFKSCQGLDVCEAPRNSTFCTYTIQEQQTLVVMDATKDERFATHPAVVGPPYVRFYAGIPLRTKEGFAIGTLCIVDLVPREFGREEVELLVDLARVAMDELDLRVLATTDSLTGASSRRSFKEQVKRAANLALRHHQHLSCIALDLDNFKAVNDTFGHPAGDAVLKAAAQACTEQLRSSDLFGRLGGEEFAVLLPSTDKEAALNVAEKLRVAVMQLAFEFDNRPLAITISLGVGSLDPATQDADMLLSHADAALYEAKAAGRNRSAVWNAPEKQHTLLRRRVLKGGRILFNGGTSSIDCTVRSLSDEGAGLDVSSSMGIPPRFALAIRADDFERPCRTVSQTERHLEVEFAAAA